MAEREATLVSVLGYDSARFGANDLSLSFIGRHTGVGNATSDGAGALVAAYRISPSVRIGAFLDLAIPTLDRAGVDRGQAEPTVGAFAVYEQSPDLVGVSGRFAIAYGRGTATFTRDASLPTTEAGAGKSHVTGAAGAMEIGYGVRFSPAWVAVPYLGLRYTDVSRGAYAEAASDRVLNPIAFDRYAQRLTTATAGVRLHGALSESFGLVFGLGAEADLVRQVSAFSGVSTIPNLTAFSIATRGNANRVRAAALLGVSYAVAPAQVLSAEVSVRQQAYASTPSVTALVRFTAGF